MKNMPTKRQCPWLSLIVHVPDSRIRTSAHSKSTRWTKKYIYTYLYNKTSPQERNAWRLRIDFNRAKAIWPKSLVANVFLVCIRWVQRPTFPSVPHQTSRAPCQGWKTAKQVFTRCHCIRNVKRRWGFRIGQPKLISRASVSWKRQQTHETKLMHGRHVKKVFLSCLLYMSHISTAMYKIHPMSENQHPFKI